MAARLRSLWQQIKKHRVAIEVVALVLIVVVVIALINAVVLSNGTGFNGYTVKSTATETTLSPQTKVTTTTQSQLGKTLWDWLQLLIVPLVLAMIALVFQRANSRTERQIAKDRYEQDREIAEQRYEQDQQIAHDKQQGDLLQAYLDRMSELLLKEKLRSSEVDAEVRNVARVRTITVLTQLDARRIGYVFAFLIEAGLMSTTSNNNVVSLKDADLRAVKWGQANLSNANLSNADFGEANLSNANLSNANLSNAFLLVANLSNAFLVETDLRQAKVKNEQLAKANTLIGATMPDGTKHPWS